MIRPHDIHRGILALLLPMGLVGISSCEQSDQAYSRSLSLLPTVALDNRVAYVETSFHQVFLLDPADPGLVPRIVPVGKNPTLAVKRNRSNQLLVLARGDQGSKDEAAEAAQLTLIDADSSVEALAYPLSGRFDAMAQSDDGKRAILYHSSAQINSANSTFYNPNELAIVDLDQPPSAVNPLSKSIGSYGGTPVRIEFSPPMVILGETRTLAVISAQGYATIVDLNHPQRTEIALRLSTATSGQSFTPAQILFDAENPHIYVRAAGSNDIFQISFSDGGTPVGTDNDFRVFISMLAAGRGPTDMALYGSGTARRLAVVAPDSKELVIIEPNTSRNTNIPTSLAANRLVLFQGPSQSNWALLIGQNNGSSNVVFAALDDIENKRGLALETESLGSAATSVNLLVEQGVVVVGTTPNAGRPGLTVVDLASRTFSPIGAGTSYTIDTGPTIPTRLWSVDGSDQTGLCFLNLLARDGQARLSTGEIWLDQHIKSILPLGSKSLDGRRYLVVEHVQAQNIGNLTVLDADAPDRANARTAYGFLFTNYLERAQP